MIRKIAVKPERLEDFPNCPECGSHGNIEYYSFWCGTEYIEATVRCSECKWDGCNEHVELGIYDKIEYLDFLVQQFVENAKKGI